MASGIVLVAEWCDNTDECDEIRTVELPGGETYERHPETIYLPDGTCRCGIRKHHYHCEVHGKVIQIG